MHQNSKTDYTITFKTDLEQLGRFRPLFVNNKAFPSITHMDTWLVNKADIRVTTKNLRTPTAEGLVRPWNSMFVCLWKTNCCDTDAVTCMLCVVLCRSLCL
jgi:hypothetical protein